ncbi:MAG TPA: hypothetical protein VH092_13690 [Urbifossiella sp.]|jgi:hypothetical protein|nr:hypothetical protein [Urbifossiella sp.]
MRQVPGYPLWVGTARDTRDVRAILDAEIAAVIDLAIEELPATLTRELVYLRFPVIDGPENSPAVLRAAVAALVELVAAGVPTLVACGAGMSRSPALAAAAVACCERRPMAAVLALMPGPVDVSPGLQRDLIESVEPLRGSTGRNQGVA